MNPAIKPPHGEVEKLRVINVETPRPSPWRFGDLAQHLLASALQASGSHHHAIPRSFRLPSESP